MVFLSIEDIIECLPRSKKKTIADDFCRTDYSLQGLAI
jgi:hypothetical protein